VLAGGVPEMMPPIEPKNSPGLRANVRVAYPTLTFTVISSGCPQPASSSHLGDSDPRPLASTTRSAPSVSWTVPPFDRTTRPVTRPVPVSNAGFTPSVPSRKVTLGSVLTLRRIAASRHGRLTVMPRRPESWRSFQRPYWNQRKSPTTSPRGAPSASSSSIMPGKYSSIAW